MNGLSIVVPCYNEEKSILTILDGFKYAIKNYPIEVVLVDNGSCDNSAQVLKKLLPKYSFAKTTRVEVNQGYGFGILQGLKKATGEFLGWTHADLQTDPADVVRAYELLKDTGFAKNIFVKGTRKNRSYFDQFFTLGMSCFELAYLHKFFWDINGQPNLFHRSFYESWKQPPHDFSLDLYAYYMAKKLKFDIRRFKVVFGNRVHGEASNASLKQKYNLTMRTLAFSTKLRRLGRL
jgi:glycosyltransferase involved in cell wall biosynthesis